MMFMFCFKFIIISGHFCILATFNHYSCVTFFLYLYLQVLAKLEKFKTKVSAKETPTSVESKHASEEELTDWSSVTLKFSPGVGKVSFLFSFHHMKSFHFPFTLKFFQIQNIVEKCVLPFLLS